MRHVEESVNINAKAEAVCEQLKKMEDFSGKVEFFNSIKKTNILDGRFVSEWELLLDKAPLNWTEEDTPSGQGIKFKMIEGGLDKFEGAFEFDGTRLKAAIKFEVDIPVFGYQIELVLQKKLKERYRLLLEAIKNKIEKP